MAKVSLESKYLETIDNIITPYFKVFSKAPFWRQFWAVFKIRFCHRFRNRSVFVEVGLEIIFFICTFLFCQKIKLHTNEAPDSPRLNESFPFSTIVGPEPRFGMIPNTEESARFLDILDTTPFSTPSKNSTVFFDNYEEYREYVIKNKQSSDMFMAVDQEINEAENSQTYTVSTNGPIHYWLPDYFRAISTSLMEYNGVENPLIYFDYRSMPHISVFTPDWYKGVPTAIFAYVFFCASMLVTATSFVEEADHGVRDLLTFSGLGFFVNNLVWLTISFITMMIPSIIYSILISIMLPCNFGLLMVVYILGALSNSALLLFVVALYPKGAFGMASTLCILLIFFILVFLSYLAYIQEPGHDIEKNIISILPNSCMGNILMMICTGFVRDFDKIGVVREYNVKYGFVYLSVEFVVFYALFLIVDYFKKRQSLPAPSTWKYKDPELNQDPILVENLTMCFKELCAVNHLNFSLEMGEVLAIVGPNGAGKSTLMSMLSASRVPTNGSIKFQGVNISENIETMHRMTGFCPQDNIFLHTLTAAEWLHAICVLRNEPDYDFTPILKALDLEKALNKRVGEMSGGNKRKVCLAAALVCEPPIILLDEATSGVDFTSRTRIWSHLSGLKNRTIIMATHTLEECEKIADQIMVLSHGQIDDLATPTQLRQKYQCGYIIDVEMQYKNQISTLLSQFNKEYGVPISMTTERVKFTMPMDESLNISNLLKNIDFPYLLSVQSLEEKIFEHVQKMEQQDNNEWNVL